MGGVDAGVSAASSHGETRGNVMSVGRTAGPQAAELCHHCGAYVPHSRHAPHCRRCKVVVCSLTCRMQHEDRCRARVGGSDELDIGGEETFLQAMMAQAREEGFVAWARHRDTEDPPTTDGPDQVPEPARNDAAPMPASAGSGSAVPTADICANCRECIADRLPCNLCVRVDCRQCGGMWRMHCIRHCCWYFSPPRDRSLESEAGTEAADGNGLMMVLRREGRGPAAGDRALVGGVDAGVSAAPSSCGTGAASSSSGTVNPLGHVPRPDLIEIERRHPAWGHGHWGSNSDRAAPAGAAHLGRDPPPVGADLDTCRPVGADLDTCRLCGRTRYHHYGPPVGPECEWETASSESESRWGGGVDAGVSAASSSSGTGAGAGSNDLMMVLRREGRGPAAGDRALVRGVDAGVSAASSRRRHPAWGHGHWGHRSHGDHHDGDSGASSGTGAGAGPASSQAGIEAGRPGIIDLDSPRTPGRASTQLDEPGSSQFDGTQLLDDSPLYGPQLVYGDGDINHL